MTVDHLFVCYKNIVHDTCKMAFVDPPIAAAILNLIINISVTSLQVDSLSLHGYLFMFSSVLSHPLVVMFEENFESFQLFK